ncbi:MAG TPA: hypothetical protein VEQ65_05705 [Opitutus sp.]|nr:hypothetical protein [Opitutus sp.]
MKRPLILLAVMILLVVAATWWLQRLRNPASRPPPVTIQDRKTIDFSSGKPVVKDNPAERALIDAAMKDIQDAAKNIHFAPLVPPKPEPAVAK